MRATPNPLLTELCARPTARTVGTAAQGTLRVSDRDLRRRSRPLGSATLQGLRIDAPVTSNGSLFLGK